MSHNICRERVIEGHLRILTETMMTFMALLILKLRQIRNSSLYTAKLEVRKFTHPVFFSSRAGEPALRQWTHPHETLSHNLAMSERRHTFFRVRFIHSFTHLFSGCFLDVAHLYRATQSTITNSQIRMRRESSHCIVFIQVWTTLLMFTARQKELSVETFRA